MNPVREWIDELLAAAKKKAVLNQLKRDLDERLFLFAIEIGRGQRLMPDERRAFSRTFRTAQILLLLDEDLTESPPQIKAMQNIMKQPEEEWLLKEPVVKAELEHRLKHPLSDIDNSTISPRERAMIAESLTVIATACPELLPPEEIESILDRIDHPLDRA